MGAQGIISKELSQRGQWEVHQATADRIRHCLSIANWFLSSSGFTKSYKVKTNPKQLKNPQQTKQQQQNKQTKPPQVSVHETIEEYAPVKTNSGDIHCDSKNFLCGP